MCLNEDQNITLQGSLTDANISEIRVMMKPCTNRTDCYTKEELKNRIGKLQFEVDWTYQTFNQKSYESDVREQQLMTLLKYMNNNKVYRAYLQRNLITLHDEKIYSFLGQD